MKSDEFGDHMKKYEQSYTSAKIDPSKWMAVRIDGKGFFVFIHHLKVISRTASHIAI